MTTKKERVQKEKKEIKARIDVLNKQIFMTSITGWAFFLLFGLFGIGIIIGVICWFRVSNMKKQVVALQQEFKDVERMLW